MSEETPGRDPRWPESSPSADPGGPYPMDADGAELLPEEWPPEAWPPGPETGPATAFASPAPATEAPPSPAGRTRSWWQYAAIGLAAGVAGAAMTAGAFLLWFEQEPATVVQQIDRYVVSPAGGDTDAAAVARAVLPSIVTVQVRSSSVGDFVTEGSGSGVVLTADGLLVTNEHVVEGAGQVRVIFAGGRTYPAEIVGVDAATDLAVLRIAADGLVPITFGSSDAMQIGDPAIAVGSPLGLEGGPSVTVGVVSAFDRPLGVGSNRLFGMIQTDAPITRGSSGGALVDSAGRLIGITTAIGVSDVGAEGLGFAIPVELVAVVTEQLAETGTVSHPFMGILGTTYLRQEPDGATVPAGVQVAEVIEDTAAAAAGLLTGDIILSVGDEALTNMDQLVVELRFYRVGDEVPMRIERGGEQLTITVTLMERPEGV